MTPDADPPARALTVGDLAGLPADTELRATTPHGSYVFDVISADQAAGRVVLGLREVHDTDQVWGTHYGDKRHLIRPGTRQTRTVRRRTEEGADALCRSTIYLSKFSDDSAERDAVLGRAACPSCLKAARRG